MTDWWEGFVVGQTMSHVSGPASSDPLGTFLGIIAAGLLCLGILFLVGRAR